MWRSGRADHRLLAAVLRAIGTVLYPENILDAGRFEIKTAQAAVRINPEYSHLAQARMIDGKKYILIPIEEGIEVNGLAVTAPDQ